MAYPQRFTHDRVVRMKEKRALRPVLWRMAKQQLVDEGDWPYGQPAPTEHIIARFNRLCIQRGCSSCGTRDEVFQENFDRPRRMDQQPAKVQVTYALEQEMIKSKGQRRIHKMKEWIERLAHLTWPQDSILTQRYCDEVDKLSRQYKLPGFVYKKTTRYDKPPA